MSKIRLCVREKDGGGVGGGKMKHVTEGKKSTQYVKGTITGV